MIHATPHPRAGQTVRLKDGTQDVVQGAVIGGATYRVEDWWDRIGGGSWMFSNGNPAAINYALRAATNDLPMDDEVVYGKIGFLGHIVHTSEIED